MLIVIAILFLGHYFVYASVLYFFGISAFEYRMALATALFLLPLCVIGSMFLAHWSEHFLTRIFYFCSTLWLGVGLTLFTTFGCAWLAWGVAAAAAHDPNRAWFGWAALGVSVLYSVYGVVNAYHPRLVHYTVRIKNLPPEWRGRKVVQLSDVHLGRILGARFLSRVVDKVNAQKPSMVLITGDLFDGALGNLKQLVAPLNRLEAPQGIYFVTGNHETYLGVHHALEALRATPVKVLADECTVVDGLQIIGISYPERGHPLRFEDKIAGLTGFNPAQPSILLYHAPTQIEAAKAAGISLQLSGHVHQGQIFPLQFFTRLIYGKYHHGLHQKGDFTIYTTSGTGLWGPTMRTGNHPEIVVLELQESGGRSQ